MSPQSLDLLLRRKQLLHAWLSFRHLAIVSHGHLHRETATARCCSPEMSKGRRRTPFLKELCARDLSCTSVWNTQGSPDKEAKPHIHKRRQTVSPQ
jgi:hypothetical protein